VDETAIMTGTATETATETAITDAAAAGAVTLRPSIASPAMADAIIALKARSDAGRFA
jgi:hypothetical protein